MCGLMGQTNCGMKSILQNTKYKSDKTPSEYEKSGRCSSTTDTTKIHRTKKVLLLKPLNMCLLYITSAFGTGILYTYMYIICRYTQGMCILYQMMYALTSFR